MAPLPTPTSDDPVAIPQPSTKWPLSDINPPQEAATTTLSPMEAHDLRIRTLNSFKTTSTPFSSQGSGSQSPESFNNAGILALFAIIGAAMVLASIWFFFWAKNGGFHFRSTDWDDYKSTVLRRKGPDGRTLSNATKSTKLGGSTIAGTQHYKWAQAEARSVVGRDKKGRKGFIAKRGWGGTHSILYSDDDYRTDTLASRTIADPEMGEMPRRNSSPGNNNDYRYHHHSNGYDEPVSSSHAQRYRDRDVQEYKKERPARVGGLNRTADGHGSGLGASAYTLTEGSEVSANSGSSERPLMPKSNTTTTNKKSNTDRDRQRAERLAREEAAKMERRWKREAEEAAAALARERNASPPPPAHTTTNLPKRASPSPKKAREAAAAARRASSGGHYNNNNGTTGLAGAAAAASDVLSNSAYTYNTQQSYTGTGISGSSGHRSASYYDAYRPRGVSSGAHEDSPLHPSGGAAMPGAFEGGRSGGGGRQGSPGKKTQKGRGGRAGGYRRGADSDFD